jgi:superfamily II DNA or RNA helicase
VTLTDSFPKASEIVEKVKSKLAELLQTDSPLYHVQEKALGRLIEETWVRNHLVFQLPTGAGKTRVVAAYLWGLYFLGRVKNGDKILFLTPRRVIRDQVREEEFSLLLREPFKIERFGEDVLAETLSEELHSKLTSRGSYISVMVITPQLLSTHYTIFGRADYENVKAILLDEGHYMYWGQEMSKIISVFLEDEGRIILAFTATPTSELINSLGYPVYHYHSLKAMEKGILIGDLKVCVYDTIVGIDTDSFNRLAIDDRARKYAEEIIRILEEEARESGYSLQERIPKTLVVAANVSEANKIFDKLFRLVEELGEYSKLEKDDFRKTHFIGCAHYKMGPSNEDAKKTIDEFKKSNGGILVTVNMADMGFDDRNLEVLVIAREIKTPVAYVQIRGRVLRKCDTNDPRNIKRQKGYAVLVDLAGSAEEHEEKEIIEQVEEGGFSSQGVYADLGGVFEKEGVKEVEASVEVKPLKTFMVRESEPESEPEDHISSEEMRKKQIERMLGIIHLPPEKKLRKCKRFINYIRWVTEEIARELKEECGKCGRCEKRKRAEELLVNFFELVREEKVHSTARMRQIYETLVKNAVEQGCSARTLYLNLKYERYLRYLDLLKDLSKKLERERDSARFLPKKCPRCGSDTKERADPLLTDKELRRLRECPKCMIRFIEKYEKRDSQWVLVSKEILSARAIFYEAEAYRSR